MNSVKEFSPAASILSQRACDPRIGGYPERQPGHDQDLQIVTRKINPFPEGGRPQQQALPAAPKTIEQGGRPRCLDCTNTSGKACSRFQTSPQLQLSW